MKMKIGITAEPHARGIRPVLRYGLLAADFLLSIGAVAFATEIADVHSATVRQLAIVAMLLFVTGSYAQFRYESARTFDFHDVLRLLLGALAAALVAFACIWLFVTPLHHVSGRLVAVSAMTAFTLRMFLRIGLVLVRTKIMTHRPNAQRVVVVGVGMPAATLIREIQEDRDLPIAIMGCVDDGIAVKRVDGVRILGSIENLPAIVTRLQIDSVIVAIPAAPLQTINRIKQLCSGAPGAKGEPPTVKVVPNAADLLNDRVTISRIRDIRLEDVLSREPVVVDTASLRPHLENQVVLVTGAGGSIGSELCRQIVTFDPKLLVLLGHGENSLFAIEQELRCNYGFTRTKMILADVADAWAVRSTFGRYYPRVVFHAAAHKHVPIVEANICEAVRNNVIGTRTVALAAAATGAAKFVLLSTDKAVNPSSVMGLTKRMAELVVQSFAGGSATEFVAVRFGNVLGSRGSVIPIFKQQVAAGGPVTITHRDMRRYFMTIPEAVSLVLQAMSIGRDGEVFVLDMGDPIRIMDLAEQVIRLSGFTPHQDIDIVETQMRPGEKLFEEILTNREDFSRSSHERLFIAQQDRLDYSELGKAMMQLQRIIRASDWRAALNTMRHFVPEYTPDAGLQLTQSPQTAVVERDVIEANHQNDGVVKEVSRATR
ncbi:MAG TPA: nucleoside-diphosphate sugar epimerase/dehydratase [Candidatus Baltobacteraceae bacterium]|nr:nucleoside-diphosphate sugar epimerase/dehydratase [Candidatus Baltobacteraceae bacterium]